MIVIDLRKLQLALEPVIISTLRSSGLSESFNRSIFNRTFNFISPSGACQKGSGCPARREKQ